MVYLLVNGRFVFSLLPNRSCWMAKGDRVFFYNENSRLPGKWTPLLCKSANWKPSKNFLRWWGYSRKFGDFTMSSCCREDYLSSRVRLADKCWVDTTATNWSP